MRSRRPAASVRLPRVLALVGLFIASDAGFDASVVPLSNLGNGLGLELTGGLVPAAGLAAGLLADPLPGVDTRLPAGGLDLGLSATSSQRQADPTSGGLALSLSSTPAATSSTPPPSGLTLTLSAPTSPTPPGGLAINLQ